MTQKELEKVLAAQGITKVRKCECCECSLVKLVKCLIPMCMKRCSRYLGRKVWNPTHWAR